MIARRAKPLLQILLGARQLGDASARPETGPVTRGDWTAMRQGGVEGSGERPGADGHRRHAGPPPHAGSVVACSEASAGVSFLPNLPHGSTRAQSGAAFWDGHGASGGPVARVRM